MPKIPTITPQQTVEIGAPSSRATAEQFGSQKGAALMDLGRSFQDLGASVAGLAQEYQANKGATDLASAAALADFTPQELELETNAPANGAEHYDTVKDSAVKWVDDTVNDYAESHPGDKKGADTLRKTLLARMPGILSRAAVEQYRLGRTSAEADMRDGYNTQLNAIRTDPRMHGVSLGTMIQQIDALPLTAEARRTAIENARSDAAVSYFEGKAQAVKGDPALIQNLQKELQGGRWQDDLTADHYAVLSKSIAALGDDANSVSRAVLGTRLSTAASRTNSFKTTGDPNDLMLPAEVDQMVADALAYGTPADIANANQIKVYQDSFRGFLDYSADTVGGIANDALYGAYNVTPATGKLAAYAQPNVNVQAMDARLQDRLARMFADMPSNLKATIISGYRNPEDQARVRAQVKAKYGPKARAAIPGMSLHQYGQSADVDGTGLEWLRKNASKYGLVFPFNDDRVHVQLAESTTEYPAQQRSLEAARAYEAKVAGLTGVGPRMLGGIVVPESVVPRLNTVANMYGVPANLLGAVWRQESGGLLNPANSPKGAQGPFQFMPDTWAQYGKGGDPNNFNDASDAAARYLSDLLKKYNGNTELALMAYNWGPGNVDKYTKGELPGMPAETQNYVKAVVGYMTSEGWQGSANMPGFVQSNGQTQPGFMTNEQWYAYDAARGYQAAQFTAMNENMASFMANNPSQGYAITPLGLGSTAMDFAARGQSIVQGAHALAASAGTQEISTPKPFTPVEEVQLETLLSSGTQAEKIDVYSKLAAMDPVSRGWAYDQLGAKEGAGTYAAAAALWADGRQQTAIRVTDGLDRVKSYPTKPQWLKDTEVEGAWFDQGMDAIIAGLPQQYRDNFKAGVDAIYSGGHKPEDYIDWEDYKTAIEEYTGMQFDTVNGEDILIPKGINKGSLEVAVDVMTLPDWIEQSEGQLPPVDANNQPIMLELLQSASFLPVDDQGNFKVVLSDGPVLVPSTTGLPSQAFIFHADPGYINDVANAVTMDITGEAMSFFPPVAGDIGFQMENARRREAGLPELEPPAEPTAPAEPVEPVEPAEPTRPAEPSSRAIAPLDPTEDPGTLPGAGIPPAGSDPLDYSADDLRGGAGNDQLNDEGTYTVKKGDNLTKIAKRFGTTIEAIAQENGIKDVNKIKKGQKLVIPGAAPVDAPKVERMIPNPPRRPPNPNDPQQLTGEARTVFRQQVIDNYTSTIPDDLPPKVKEEMVEYFTRALDKEMGPPNPKPRPTNLRQTVIDSFRSKAADAPPAVRAKAEQMFIEALDAKLVESQSQMRTMVIAGFEKTLEDVKDAKLRAEMLRMFIKALDADLARQAT